MIRTWTADDNEERPHSAPRDQTPKASAQRLFTPTRAMLIRIWDQHAAQAKDIIHSGKRQITDIGKQIEAMLDRIIASTNATVIRTYEDKISDLEQRKRILAEQLAR